jgi:hypothetical protein
MKFLEAVAGALVALLSLLILLVGSVFALGSIGKYIRAKNM